MTSHSLLDPAKAVVAMIDIQQNHFPAVVDGEATLDRLVRFVKAARILGTPVVWTEHYPQAFGPTLPQVAEALAGIEPIAKVSFGCFGEPAFRRAVEQTGAKTLYLVGSETHICILQTALAALDAGLNTVVVADCVSSRGHLDHRLALQRVQRAGALLATWEMILYEWMRTGRHPQFKAVLPLVKGTS